MVDYLFRSKVALDPTTESLVVNGSLTVHALDDVNGENPLPISDLSGLPLSAVKTTRQGVTEPFICADHDTVVLRSGPYAIEVESLDGVRSAAEAAAADAAASANAAQEAADRAGTGGGVTDHGLLAGLGADDHPQYLTAERGDQRYYTKEAASALVANSVSAAAPANRDRANHTGQQAVSTITGLESRLAALESGATGGGSGILVLPEGAPIPLGTPPGVILRIPDEVVPTPTLFESVSYTSEGTTATCPIPTGVQVGDAVVFVAAFDPATGSGQISVTDAGWEEFIDYSPNHSRDTAMYVYRVSDATALANLGTAVTATYDVAARRMGAVTVIPGSLVASAWPTYSSGSNRSAATINNSTTTGCTVQAFNTATVPFHKVMLAITCDAASAPAEADGFEVLGFATASSGGAEPRTLTVMIRDENVAPVAAANVTHPTAASTAHGGGQFIIPVAV